MSEMFDRLAKRVAEGVSRRDALRYLGGILAGGFLAGLSGKARADDDDGGDDDDDAIEKACKAYCKNCPKKPHEVRKRCRERCERFLRKNPKGTLCGTCTAQNPFTGCPDKVTCCAATTAAAAYCANTNTDVKNCGKCGTQCTKGTTPACCSGTCTDLDSDVNNCGACGNVCPPPASGAAATCTGGKCG